MKVLRKSSRRGHIFFNQSQIEICFCISVRDFLRDGERERLYVIPLLRPICIYQTSYLGLDFFLFVNKATQKINTDREEKEKCLETAAICHPRQNRNSFFSLSNESNEAIRLEDVASFRLFSAIILTQLYFKINFFNYLR